MTDKRRLIEVAFPLKQASVASVHEKNVRHGHISTLHVWPARRPLAASRAALLATLIPDPEDPMKRQELLRRIGGQIVRKHVKDIDKDGNTLIEDKDVVEGGVLAWGQENASDMDGFRQMIRQFYDGEIPKVLDPFAGGGAIPFEAMRLACDVTASDLNPVAWLILKCTVDYPQQFAGKQWPLPAFVRQWPDFVEDFLAGKVKRRKSDRKIHFSDPRQLELMELPDADLAWHVRAWGRWVLERARADLAPRYPVVNGEPTLAYLWARTARDKMTAGRVPLLKTFWLCKKKGSRVALLPVPNGDGSGVTFGLLREAEINNPDRTLSQYPFLRTWEVTADTLEEFLSAGTMNSAGVWSPISGRPGMIALTMDDLRRQGQQRLLSSQMTAVVVEAKTPGRKTTYKRYRLPVETELQVANVQAEDVQFAFEDIPFGAPCEQIVEDAKRNTWCVSYGINQWSDLFTPRQLLSTAVFVKHTRTAIEQVRATDLQSFEAVAGYLAIALDRMVDRGSNVCSWTLGHEQIRNTFARFALPVAWDHAECVPHFETSGGYPGQIELVAKFISKAMTSTKSRIRPTVVRQSALIPYAGTFDLILTDPPYYDAIGYSVLMDFFYVWLRRIVGDSTSVAADVFSTALSPKWDADANDGELIDDAARFSGNKDLSKKNYEGGMARAFRAFCDALSPNGRIVVVFANKSVDAWETLVGALIRGGAIVTASWPIQTEREARARSLSSAALSSSVWIVCRKRLQTATPGWEERVVDRMKETLFSPRAELADRNILQYYFDLGITGPDFIWAALGPALEAYSAHPFVKKTAGGVLTVKEFLTHVRKLVLQFSLGELPGFKDLQQETQGRGESLELDSVTQYYLLHRAYFGLDPAPAGACILYANACGKNETELKVVWNILEQGGKTRRGRPRNDELEESTDESESAEESKGNEYRLLSWEERASREGLGEVRGGQPAPLIDRLQRLMYLFQQNRASEVQQLFDNWALANERAFKPLLQAVRELALRDKKDSERRIVEALATQLRMNRKMVMVANEMKEVDLFEAADKGNAAAVQDQVGKD